jgi:predicted PurR-regulated permease PerM
MEPPRSDEKVPAIKRRRRVAVLLVFVGLILALLFALRAVLAPFLIALFVAYLLDPLVDRLAEVRLYKKRFRVGRGGSIVIIYLVFLIAVYIGGSVAIPGFGRQLRQIRGDLPAAQAFVEDQAEYVVEKWSAWWGEEEGNAEGAAEQKAPAPEAPAGPVRKRFLLKGGGAIEGTVEARAGKQVVVNLGGELTVLDSDRVSQEETLEGEEMREVDVRVLIRRGITEGARHLDSILAVTIRFAVALTKTLYLMVLVMMVTAFLVVDSKAIIRFFYSVPPARHQQTVRRLGYSIDRGLAGVIRGQLAICLVNGFLTWIGLEIFGVRYAAVLGLVAGIFSLIPIFGTILSSIPIVLIALGTGGLEKGLFALGWILLIHFVEANFLNPKIMGTASKIHPVLVIFALLAGEHAYGIVGALLAVPTASIIQSVFRFYVIDHVNELPDKEPAVAT